MARTPSLPSSQWTSPPPVGQRSEDDDIIDASLLEAGRVVTDEEIDRLNQAGDDHRSSGEADDEISADLEQLRDEARKQGYEAGCRQAAQLMAEIACAQRDAEEQAFQELVDITMTTVRKLLGEVDRADLVAAAIADITQNPGRHQLCDDVGRLTLIVHPSQEEDVRQRLENRLSADTVKRSLEIACDDEMAIDRCLLTGALGTVELGIEQQLEALRCGLLGKGPLSKTEKDDGKLPAVEALADDERSA